VAAVELPAAEQLTRYLMAYHGLSGWRFRFDKATRRFGCCDYTRRTISLSRRIVLLNDADRVRATVLHEIAHALAGPGTGHSRQWREIALRIGGDGRRCYGSEVTLPPKAQPQRARQGPARAFVVSMRGVVTAPRSRTRRDTPAFPPAAPPG
jgi:hypothetical protein